MSKNTDAQGVPLGEPPEAVRAQRDHIRAAVEGARPERPAKRMKLQQGPADKVAKFYDTKSEGRPCGPIDPADLKALVFKTPDMKLQPLTIEHDLFTLDIEVYEFTVSGNFVTILFPSTFGLAEPRSDCKLRLKYGGRTYPVDHLGINFEIKTLKMKGVAFLLDQHDQTRQIGAGDDSEPGVGETGNQD